MKNNIVHSNLIHYAIFHRRFYLHIVIASSTKSWSRYNQNSATRKRDDALIHIFDMIFIQPENAKFLRRFKGLYLIQCTSYNWNEWSTFHALIPHNAHNSISDIVIIFQIWVNENPFPIESHSDERSKKKLHNLWTGIRQAKVAATSWRPHFMAGIKLSSHFLFVCSLCLLYRNCYYLSIQLFICHKCTINSSQFREKQYFILLRHDYSTIYIK